MNKLKIYVFINGYSSIGVHPVALAEDGHCLTGHACSHESFVKHDMGITSDWKHKVYDKHYPDGWELIYIDNPEKALKNNEGFKLAIKRNEKLR